VLHHDDPTTDPAAQGTDAAAYQAFARTWAAVVRRSPSSAEELEQRVVELFRRLCRRLQPAVVLEIGAHEATFSRWAAEELPDARVLAFEANPHVHEKYAGTLAGTRVDYRNLAVGPTNGEVVLNLPLEVRGKPRTLTSRMASLAVHTRATDQVQVTVPAVRLDDHVRLAEGERVVAWIDVEGANEAVLTSGPSILDRTDALYVEVERETTWEGQWLDQDVAVELRRHGLLPVARDLKRRHQYNVLYVRAEIAAETWTAQRAAEALLGRPAAGELTDG
jgi:FkbM family methyltransferase